ncbi:MAG: HAMP domain-containing protein [Planctomycetes bacterium]|nr:HAMP domain-containing protein [Planctomycetota bacterium]
MLNHWSIRWRLTLWYVLALTAILAVFDVALVLMARSHLRAQLEADLNEEVNELAEEIEFAKSPKEFETRFTRHYAEHGGYSFQISRFDGTVLFGSPWLRAHPLPKPKSSDEFAFRRMEEITLAHAGRHRMLCRAVHGPSEPLVIYVMTPLARSERELWSFVQMLLVGSLLALLVAFVGGFAIARHAMAPVERIVATAERISCDNLSDRIFTENRNDELGRLAATLNATFGHMETAVAEMRRFTADAAHELRTPLAVIRTEMEVALRGSPSTESLRQVLQVTIGEIARLSGLVDKLLTLSRHDGGVQPLNREEVLLSAVLRDVIDFMTPMATEKQIVIQIADLTDSVVIGDDVSLSQLFFNLLENAIKFTPAGGNIHIRDQRSDGRVVIAIEDSGVGIDPRHLPHVFKRFYRVDTSRNSSTGGTGLGLAICQSIVHAHAGRLTVTSEVGCGSVFVVGLPATSDHQPQAPRPSSIPVLESQLP